MAATNAERVAKYREKNGNAYGKARHAAERAVVQWVRENMPGVWDREYAKAKQERGLK